MTDLERKLAEALRGQAEEVTPNLDAAWAEQMRRQRKPRRRRATVWLAPLAAVLVVLTSVLLATQLQGGAPTSPGRPGVPLDLPEPDYGDANGLSLTGLPITEFAGQTDRWEAYGVLGSAVEPVRSLFCLLATPRGTGINASSPQYGTKSPACVSISTDVVRSGYVGETDGPLPADKAVYLVDPAVRELWLFDAEGDPNQARAIGMLGPNRVFLATINPDSPPVSYQLSSP
ncbi:hypothetical protein Amsp01_023480 [Amycolatopsis sp. NBRC 101858]|uniref:hypothetical protein n=1 Tax=Amycolatopsis sp. NBRC 101858 TaxID=3032200 RepID=UPI0024A1E54C|nr:hypothetical protein [Amycolatopsis sp. NBRC 101858]GLY36324.1 hypothetical protein Amsp01_023480 [Amycolatopsis sp. NBRC 101858]